MTAGPRVGQSSLNRSRRDRAIGRHEATDARSLQAGHRTSSRARTETLVVNGGWATKRSRAACVVAQTTLRDRFFAIVAVARCAERALTLSYLTATEAVPFTQARQRGARGVQVDLHLCWARQRGVGRAD